MQGNYPLPPQAMMERIYTLWETLDDYDVATNIDTARNHLMETLCKWIDAGNATWVGVVRMNDAHPEDPLKGWRPASVLPWKVTPQATTLIKRHARQTEYGNLDEVSISNAKTAGQWRVNSLKELASPAWFKGRFYHDFYLSGGWADALWAGVPLNEDAECFFGFFRATGKPEFTAEDKSVVYHTLRGLRTLHRMQMLSEGQGIVSTPLTPTERKVLQGILQGLSEKQIAAANGQSQHTAHEYVTRIFRKYGVSGRSALMALWLGGTAPAEKAETPRSKKSAQQG